MIVMAGSTLPTHVLRSRAPRRWRPACQQNAIVASGAVIGRFCSLGESG
jgi:hypothetical protein